MEVDIHIYICPGPIVHASILMIKRHNKLVQTDPFVEQHP
jgi:hypothetical protein